MIPLARDALPMIWWRATENDDDGDVTTTWECTRITVIVTSYSIQSTVTQTEDGQVHENVVSLLFSLPDGCEPLAGDRLGTIGCPTIHLRDVRIHGGQAECTGVRL